MSTLKIDYFVHETQGFPEARNTAAFMGRHCARVMADRGIPAGCARRAAKHMAARYGHRATQDAFYSGFAEVASRG